MEEEMNFESFISSKIRSLSNYSRYSKTYNQIIFIILQWELRFSHNPIVWKRFTKGNFKRLIKELNESIPVIDRVIDHIANLPNNSNSKVTIFDLCSGFGFLSMFLSELLSPEKVKRIVLIDKQWSREAINQKMHISSSKGIESKSEDNTKNQSVNFDDNDNGGDGDNVVESNLVDEIDEENQGHEIEGDDKEASNKYISVDHLVGMLIDMYSSLSIYINCLF